MFRNPSTPARLKRVQLSACNVECLTNTCATCENHAMALHEKRHSSRSSHLHALCLRFKEPRNVLVLRALGSLLHVPARSWTRRAVSRKLTCGRASAHQRTEIAKALIAARAHLANAMGQSESNSAAVRTSWPLHNEFASRS